MQKDLFPAAQAEAYTVSSLSRYIRELFDVDYRLQDVWVEGEVSDVRRPSSGHLYFTLKDAGAQLRVVMWRNVAQAYISQVVQGAKVLTHGKVSVYEAGGTYQLYADVIQVAGAGDLHRQFELLKARLEAEGLFDPARKRPLPAFPHRVGLVTSPSTAAIRDILNVLQRRWPLLELIVSPAPVQGDDAPPKIVAALEALYRRDDLDLIVVARGGGSIEDLWCFNDERVVRKIAASPVPVVSGVGHEIDFTIADFVADQRAPTPSAAAELITPDRAQFAAQVYSLSARLADAAGALIHEQRRQVQVQARALAHLSPQVRLANARQRLDDVWARAATSLAHALQLRRERVSRLNGGLNARNPLAVLKRGYALVSRAADGALVSSTAQLVPGDRVAVRVADGEFGGVVETLNPNP
ncbi:MAG: exodeoxyribonuclease VII large subunit [Thermoflexales bacterium]|nr:exodeoxyribonuclease VII large subunit [Thermoflexales bacterium]